ncbi:biotin transporter BioY [Desulfosporosinus sp. BG]|uniref:biotin transporter BioY n=1 Tax=Desulfosporosinus sp. BG TaxID=1633135 RepID=UPI00083B7B87|nr:biotin transporter BioY [Desulfosporosinus sp. BG]ODA39636.1 Substrate-specific component BioY of biotin ECF transporter [Desulfosporosinus sp. BG]
MKTRKLAMTSVMAALMCLAGMLLHWAPGLVPFSILPIFVYISGLILGAEYAALAMLVYLVLGLFGFPVFATAPFGGLGYILKPTFGFLLGYVAAAYVVGYVYREGSLWRAIIGVLAGLITFYLFGLSYLYIILQWVLHQQTSVEGVLMIGFVPFILGDLIKAGIAVWIGQEVVRRRQGA